MTIIIRPEKIKDCYPLIRDRPKINSFITSCSEQNNQPERLLIIRRKEIRE